MPRKMSISLYEFCIQNKKNQLLNEWDFEKNIENPQNIAKASKKKVWWKCEKCENEFQMTVQNRTLQNSKCPKCAEIGRRDKWKKNKLSGNSLFDADKELLKKWNYDKNKDITPKDVTRHSSQIVWWKCPICENEFQSRVNDVRISEGCSKCRGNKYINVGRDGKYAVYCHTCPDGKRYIGFTGSPIKERFGNGSGYKENTRFGKAIQCFGWENIKHEVLFVGLTLKEAEQKEKELIKKYKTTNELYGYNMSDGGRGGAYRGQIFSQERKERISQALTGRKISEEERRKLSEAHKGLPSGNRKKVIQLDLNGNIVNEFVSMTEANKTTGISLVGISACCTGRNKTSGGYKWKYN